MTYSVRATPESLQRPPRTSWRVDQAECHSFRGRSGVWEGFPRCRLQRRDADDRDRGRPRDADAPGVGESLPCRGPAPSRVRLRLHLLPVLGPAQLPCGIHLHHRRIPAACSDGSPSQTSRRSSSPVNRNDQSGVSDFIAPEGDVDVSNVGYQLRQTLQWLLPTVAFPSPSQPSFPHGPWGSPSAVWSTKLLSLKSKGRVARLSPLTKDRTGAIRREQHVYLLSGV